MRMVDLQAAWTVVRRKIVERSRRKRFMVSLDLHDVVVFTAYSASVCIDLHSFGKPNHKVVARRMECWATDCCAWRSCMAGDLVTITIQRTARP